MPQLHRGFRLAARICHFLCKTYILGKIEKRTVKLERLVFVIELAVHVIVQMVRDNRHVMHPVQEVYAPEPLIHIFAAAVKFIVKAMQELLKFLSVKIVPCVQRIHENGRKHHHSRNMSEKSQVPSHVSINYSKSFLMLNSQPQYCWL